jgi:adenylate cyclase
MKPSPEIEAVVRRLFTARDRLDTDTVRNLHTTTQPFRLIGTADEEWIEDPSQGVLFWRAFAENVQVASSELIRLEAFESGDTGWAIGEHLWTEPNGTRHPVRFTLVLAVQSGSWRVVHSHYSYPVGNEEVHGPELSETLRQLLTSLEPGDVRPVDPASGTATVMFTDLADSTALAGSMTDDEFRRLIRDHLSSLHLVAERHGGTMVKTLGDGAMFVFPSAASALTSAVAMQVATAASSELGLRVGVHTGDVVREAGDYLGLTVHKAARIAGVATAGQILASATTVGMVNPKQFSFGRPFRRDLEGFPSGQEIVPILWGR